VATLEQERAAFALEQVESVLNDEKKRAKYKTQLLKLPARLHTNGLGQTVAFYISAGSGKPETEICRWIEQWLQKRIPALQGRKLIDCIAGRGVPEADAERIYREAAAETRALAVWLKRFAEAFIEGSTE
jgi:CRISPR-associated protein Cmr5